MICTTIQNKTLAEIMEILPHVEMAEIRLDRCQLTEDEVEECFDTDVPLVATCRVMEVMMKNPSMTEKEAADYCENLLTLAIETGAAYVDVEFEAPRNMSKKVRSIAHKFGTVFIRSFHDFSGTSALESLKYQVDTCRMLGGDVVKLVTTAHSPADAERVMSLYDEYEPSHLIAFCMGEEGRDSRLQCLAKGAPYTYAALTEEDAAAPGQWPTEEMRKALYGDFKFIGIKDGPSGEAVSVAIPSSKSFAQRAIICAALAEGTSHLEGYTACGDNEAALAVARAIGADVIVIGDKVSVTGIGAEPNALVLRDLHVGESGLLTRLMIPLVAQISEGATVLTGEKTLTVRSLGAVPEMMSAFGVRVESEAEDCRIPVTVTGPLNGGKARISGKSGSQLISGLLMALPLGQKAATVTVREPKSIPYMFITLDVMRKFGVTVANEMLGGRDFMASGGDWSKCNEMIFKVKGGQKYKSADFRIEGDWSSAANFLVAAAIFGKLEINGLDTKSLQADISILDILSEAGASVSQLYDHTGVITVQRAPLEAFKTDATNCPDLFPILAVLAAFCQGQSKIRGVSRLAHKESDRGKAILEMLHQMGVEADVHRDEMRVQGKSLAYRLLNKEMLRGGNYSSNHDHRMVMALKVAELGADGKIVIDDEECVGKSFPTFGKLFGTVKV